MFYFYEPTLDLLQIDFSSEKYQEAVERLKDCLSKENLDSITKIAEKRDTLTDDQMSCGIAVHIIKKLSGQASVNRSKSKEKCPCGCDDRVDSGSMWIGKAFRRTDPV